METWTHGGMRAWKHGGMEAWRHEGMEAWRHGGMEAWRHKGMGVPNMKAYRPCCFGLCRAFQGKGIGCCVRDLLWRTKTQMRAIGRGISFS